VDNYWALALTANSTRRWAGYAVPFQSNGQEQEKHAPLGFVVFVRNIQDCPLHARIFFEPFGPLAKSVEFTKRRKKHEAGRKLSQVSKAYNGWQGGPSPVAKIIATIKPYNPKASAKIRINTIGTNNLGC